jgi:putative SOS response-associated peptidase YedK
MCGRFTLTMDQEALEVALGVEGLVHPRARYNIAPTQEVPAVVGAIEDGRLVRRGTVLRWGLVPSWAEDPSIGNRLINARSETAHRKPSFRSAFRHGRCLVPADGFYEWRKDPEGKTPFWVHLEEAGVFTFAGLRERWERGAETLESFTILTRDADELLRPIHDRMPVIVPPAERDRWLDPSADPEELRALMDRFTGEGLAVRQVSRRVNSPANDDPACLDPPPGPADDLPLFRGPD